jgi:hypothetical protein
MATKITKIKSAENIDPRKYVNYETGETLDSEISNEHYSVSIGKSTGLVKIESDDYAVLDSEAYMFLAQVLNNSDLANVLRMSVTTKTALNIVFNSTVPHSNETLQKHLQIKSESKYMGLIRRLIKAGVLYQIKGLIYGEVRVCYMLNPYISRKRKTIEERVFDIFNKFTIDQPPIKEGDKPDIMYCPDGDC